MSKLPVKNLKGEQVGEYDVADSLLVYDKGHQAVHEAVVMYRANQRAGTASTLGKGEVAGSGCKPWKQKGTGRARAGYQQSPVWRGGSVAFGPKPRSFEKKMPRKVARLAFRRAFSEKLAAGQILVVEDIAFDAPKTKAMADLLKQIGALRGAVVVLDGAHNNVRLSARNLPLVQVTTAQHLNVYELLRYPSIVVSKQAMDVLATRLQDGRKG